MSAITTYLHEVREEFNKVTWPSREQLFRLSLAVVVVSGVTGVVLGMVDLLLGRLMTMVLPG